jgi:hypothetical protein
MSFAASPTVRLNFMAELCPSLLTALMPWTEHSMGDVQSPARHQPFHDGPLFIGNSRPLPWWRKPMMLGPVGLRQTLLKSLLDERFFSLLFAVLSYLVLLMPLSSGPLSTREGSWAEPLDAETRRSSRWMTMVFAHGARMDGV